LGLDFGCSSDRSAIMQILKKICYQENAAGWPLLPAVAVSIGVGYPAMGFFLLARELGLNTFADDRSFFYYELNRVQV